MTTGIEIQEPFRLPDMRRPAAMPSLPEWCALRIAAVKRETQPDEDGKWRPVLTLPASMALSATLVAEIKVHIVDLERLCDPTPENDANAESEMLALLSEMMLALPSVRKDELATMASGAALMMAVEDLPVWCVKSAYRRWCRNDVGSDRHGNPFNTRWLPSPAELREVADREISQIKSRVCELRMLTTTVPLIEYSGEHCADMRKRLHEMWNDIAANGGHGLRPDLSPRGEKSRAA